MGLDTSATGTTKPAFRLGSGTGTQLFLGLLWLGITVWTTHATIKGSEEDISGVLGQAAEALPGLVATTMVTGASIASAAASRFDRALSRLLIGVIAGALFGVVVAFGLRLAYGTDPSITSLAVTAGIAAAVGGALAILPNGVLESALWAVSWVFFAFLILGVLQPQLLNLLGGGKDADAAAQATADTRFLYLAAAAAGLLAAVHASRTMRVEGSSAGWYLIAGGLPGIILILSEVLVSRGGTALATLVHGFTAGDAPTADPGSAARMRDALIVLAVGAVVSFLNGLRHVRAAKAEAEAEARAEAEAEARERAEAESF